MLGQPAPVDVGQIEHVEVRYALVDVLVLDARDRTVPGLAARDFELYVDGEPVAVVSVDESCAEGQVDDPRGGEGPVGAALRAGGPPARFVHVFDYPHLEHPTEALTRAREALERRGRELDEHVVAVFNPGLRIESAPARGTADALRALVRMESDRTLYDGAYARLTERGFFRSLEMLLDVLEVWPGAKVVLLYSGPFLADGFDHDVAHREVAARAARARVALYTIDAAGMRTPKGFRYGDLGGSRMLARLAIETGGRSTRNTNDLGLGYARAQRDLACRYTLGFYERSASPDQPQRLTIRTLRAGARVVHPAAYAPQSPAKRHESRLAGALAAPELFPRGGLAVEVESVESDAVPAVRLRLRLAPSWPVRDPAGWTLVGRITRRTGVVVHELEAPLAGGAGDTVELGEVRDLSPRPYRLTIVAAHPEVETPFAVSMDFEVPESPRGRDPQRPVSDSP